MLSEDVADWFASEPDSAAGTWQSLARPHSSVVTSMLPGAARGLVKTGRTSDVVRSVGEEHSTSAASPRFSGANL